MAMQRFLGKLPKRFQWTVHNVIAHPVMEIFYQLGLKGLSDRVHQATVPEESHSPVDVIDERIKDLNSVLRMLRKGNATIRHDLAKAKAGGISMKGEAARLTHVLARNEAALAKRLPGGDMYRIAHSGFKRTGAFFDGKGGMHETWGQLAARLREVS
ncbi:MAG: hypothetical protein DRQ64_00205 [Gammaproteobacteria bacterium]|nr:MAG: hypothetical protein DRQ64_00205 [Gammaproteobacteria bacterium]